MSSNSKKSRPQQEYKKFRDFGSGNIGVASQAYGETSAGAVLPIKVVDDGSGRGKVVIDEINHGDLSDMPDTGGTNEDHDKRYPEKLILNEPNGFPDATLSTISFTSGSRTFTITPTGASFNIYQQGEKYTISSADSVVISNTSGLHYIYYDLGVLTSVVNPAHVSVDDIILNKVWVGGVYWNATDGVSYVSADERHGCQMSSKTHEWGHDVIGTLYRTGFTLSGTTLDTDSNAALNFGIGNGEMYDEDIIHEIINGSVATHYSQVLTEPAEIPVRFRDAVDGTWKEQAASTLPYISAVAGNNRLAYNNDDGDGTFSQIEVTDGKWMAYTLIATNDWQYPIKMIQGQHEYATKATAIEEANTEMTAFGDFPSAEVIILYRFVMRTKNTFGGTKKAQIVDLTDFRGSQIIGTSATATSHGTLSGLADDDHAQYLLVDGTRAMSGNLNMGDNDIVGIDKLQSTGCTASGTDSVALGIDTTASGNWSTAIGSRTQAVGNYSTAMGDDTRALGHYSTTTGFLSIAQGWFSTASGFRTHADSYAGVAFGRYNVGGGTINSWVATDPLFEIGIGTATDARANALTVFKNGNFDFHAGNLTTTGNLSDGTYSLTVANAWLAYFHVTSSGTSHSGVDGVVTIHSDVSNAGSGLIITDGERTNLGTAYDYSQIGHLPLAGGTMAGGINMNTNAITGGGAGHDQFSDFVSNEHIDWTSTSSSISTTGTITSSDITIFDVTPILVFKDSNGVGGAATGFIEWRDANNTRLGTLGNGSSGTDDLNWKNESSGGHINIETTGAGKVNISANDVIMTGSLSGVVNVTATGNLSDGIESATVAELIGYSGQIQMWNGLIANIPSGWVICDGANGTPDLRDKFVRGAGAGDEAGATGGSETHIHAVTGNSAQTLIGHVHTLAAVNTGTPDGTVQVQSGTGVFVGSSSHLHCIYIGGSSTGSANACHSHPISFNSAACSTLPSYHELIFIMRS